MKNSSVEWNLRIQIGASFDEAIENNGIDSDTFESLRHCQWRLPFKLIVEKTYHSGFQLKSIFFGSCSQEKCDEPELNHIQLIVGNGWANFDSNSQNSVILPIRKIKKQKASLIGCRRR